MSDQGRDPGRRRVLLVSYYFPPSGGPGVQRVLKFTRYLPGCGWQPLVLTVDEDAAFPARDESLAAEIPDEARVFRSPIYEFYDLYRRFTGRRGSGAAVDIDTVQRSGETFRERLVRQVRGSIFIPDGRVGWMPGGLRVGRRVCREMRPDVIFASGPPFTGHWLGAKLAREHDLPLVLDFRDPWTRATFYPDRPEWAARIDRRLERSCLLQAARIVTVNEQIRDELQASAPELEADRFVVIPNGFDPADFAGIARHPSRHWTIAHVGSLFASRVPYTLLEVLERWIAEDPTVADEVRLRLVGRVCPEMIERVSRPPLSEIVIQDGYVSHAESVQAMVDADVLLLLTNEGAHDPGMITGKVFEYLGAGRPILTLAESGEATRILEMTGRGCAVAPRSAAEIRSALTSLREGSRERTSSHPGSTDAFSRPAQAQTLAATLSNAVSGSVPGQRT